MRSPIHGSGCREVDAMTTLPPITVPVDAVAHVGTFRRKRRPAWRRGPALVGLVIMAAWIVVALTLPLWTPYDPLDPVAARLQPPNGAHWMGTDALGRDVFTRALWGARVSLPIAATVIVAAVLLGTIVGAVSGFFGGWADTV